MFQDSTPALLGLGATARPAYCPSTNSTPDPCEFRYSVDIPLIGREEVGVPIFRMVDDAMKAGTQTLPVYLPTFYQELQPYIAMARDSIYKDVQALAPDLLDDLLKKQVMPKVDALKDNVLAEADVMKQDLLVTVLATAGMLMIAVGVSAWWIKR
jgi:hypothetical protein